MKLLPYFLRYHTPHLNVILFTDYAFLFKCFSQIFEKFGCALGKIIIHSNQFLITLKD